MTLKIYNVLSHKKEEFQPLSNNEVKMYACGITVSADAHIGHAYQSVVFDVISRYLTYLGYNVKYVRNYTDVDDKIIKNANLTNQDPISFAEHYINQTDKEMELLGNNPPTITARATQCIKDIIDFIQKLIDKGKAYPTDFGNVYFKINSFKNYGKLSRVQTEKNEVGVRKEIEKGKINDLDFALWKSAKYGEISWESPWGLGRPGWHIECSAMNLKYLGEQIDIHGGGRDLIFPHHENEIAQTESLTEQQFAKYWVHCGLVKINGQKMSKSLGNGILLKDVLKKYNSDIIRLSLLKNLYSSDIDITEDLFLNSKKQIYKMYSIINNIKILKYNDFDDKLTNEKITEIKDEFEKNMNDNFNTPIVLKNVLKWFSFLDGELKKKTKYNLNKIILKIIELLKVFNILQKDYLNYIENEKKEFFKNSNITEDYIMQKIQERENAKKNKNYDKADNIRHELNEKGIVLNDTPFGTKWDI